MSDLKINQLPSRNRFYVYTSITGDVNEVLAETKKRLESDHVTPMYEHMRLKINEIDLENYPDEITIVLFKNNYAGD